MARPASDTARTSGAAWTAIAVLLLSVAKGQVTRPHEWALTQLHLNYRFGVVRRGLVGQLLEVFHRDKPLHAVFEIDVMFSTLVLVLWVALVVRELRARLGLAVTTPAEGTVRFLVAMVFVSSPVIWNLALSFGYLDAVLAAAGLVLATCGSVGIGCAIVAFAVLTHEMAGLLLGPLLLLFAFDPSAPWGLSRRRATAALAALAGLAAATAWVARRSPTDAMEQQMLARAWTDPSWIRLFCELLRAPLVTDLRALLPDAHVLARFRANAVLCLPATATIVLAGCVRLHASRLSARAKLSGTALLMAASWPQLAACVLAFDHTRLFALTNLQAFLAFAMLDRRLDGVGFAPGPRTMRWLVPLAAAVVLAGLLTRARFTYLPLMQRWVPVGFDAFFPDPLGRLAEAVGTFS